MEGFHWKHGVIRFRSYSSAYSTTLLGSILAVRLIIETTVCSINGKLQIAVGIAEDANHQSGTKGICPNFGLRSDKKDASQL